MSAARSTVRVLLALVALAAVLLTPPPAAVLAHSPSTDATLGGLTLSEGRLDPVFATGTTDYAAGVGYTVTRITVVPTTTDANATVAYLDGSDTPLPDANTVTTRPQLGVALTTTLTDPDGVSGTVTYRWERSAGRSAWTDITGAAVSSLMPTSAETGHFLRVTATYTDGHGSGRTATARTSEVVAGPLLTALTLSTNDATAHSSRSTVPSYVDRQVQPETSYAYRVKARNAASLSRQSQYLNADTPAAPAQRDPRAARNLTAELVTGGGITLRWEAPAEDAESISGYEILRRRPFRGEQTLLSYVADTGSAATSYIDVDANEPGEQYVYRVVALRGAEHSGRSNRARLVAPQPDPAGLAPSNLSARVAEQGIALSWAAPPADAGAVTGYRLLRAVGDSAMSILAADTGSDATAYFDSSAVAPGETYRYQVLAVRGEKASQGSITAVVSVPESLVARAGESANAAATAPGNLTATLRDDHIGLRWTTPQEDGSSVTGYQILRSHAGSTWSVLTANTYSAATTYEDSATTQPGTYVYQVKAWRSGELSDGSNQTYAIQPESCVGDQFNSNPVDVPVSATPIVVESTPSDYFVLFVRPV